VSYDYGAKDEGSVTTAAIIVAAGRGTRAGGDLPKQWQLLAGAPVLSHSIRAFSGLVDLTILVIHPDDHAYAAALDLGVQLVHGGASRDQSVFNALTALAATDTTRVLIHDGARPLVSADLIRRLMAALDHSVGAAPALPVTDALWRGENGFVSGTQDRDGLWHAQTPQAFHFDAILAAHRAHKAPAADDVAVARAGGIEVAIVPGDEDNLKLTYPVDFARAERFLAARDLKDRTTMDIRLGNGFDVHAFCPGDHLWLCGVKISHTRGLLGHSDADVGMHALTDAIYGALAMGDIGRHFPPSDPQWKGAASHIFLSHAMDLACARGFALANADVTLICEHPKIGPHAAAMQSELARIMDVDPTRVSVKATTSEQLGFTGREEGIAAIATAALVAS
jgi:2-C-methyl-D-erythritol 4-phosphate cytidylyltransferase / 2-C-methyl-D-erythritol 2,4-cyclodiphosphate synthase